MLHAWQNGDSLPSLAADAAGNGVVHRSGRPPSRLRGRGRDKSVRAVLEQLGDLAGQVLFGVPAISVARIVGDHSMSARGQLRGVIVVCPHDYHRAVDAPHDTVQPHPCEPP
jgi:hypothetical protein